MQTALLMTGEGLLTLPDDGKSYELVRGHLLEREFAGAAQGRLRAFFAYQLHNWSKPKRAGKIFGADTGFYLARDPDICVRRT